MCLFTHFAAGALAGGLTGSPGWGVLAGLASHAVLDVLPHYDHPDWRLELGGGVAALGLLLLMPFVSGAAVLGGIAGMLPDLENLFQKLGKMRRDQFVYPTHTGLLKHGRPLGPRNLLVQAAIFVGCFLALGLARPGTADAAEDPAAVAAGAVDETAAVMARPVVRVLSATADRTVVRIDLPVEQAPADWRGVDDGAVRFALPPAIDEGFADDGRAVRGERRVLPPLLPVALAVPTRQAPSLTVADVRWWREPDASVDLGSQLACGAPAVFRSVPVAGTSVPLAVDGGILAGVTLVFDHPRVGAFAANLELARKAGGTEAAATAEWPQQVLNPELFAALARGGAEADRERTAAKAARVDPLNLTTHWVQLEVASTGLFRLTGQQLVGFGVPVGDVDPAKLRLYRGGGLALETDPEYPDSLQTARSGLNEVAIEVVGAGDGEWNLDDEIRFYGVASSAWRDRLEAGAAPLDHYDHPYAPRGIYWLTWENDGTASPLPGLPRRVGALTAPAQGGQLVGTGRLRLHREEQNADTPGAFADNWSWTTAISSTWPVSFTARTPVAGSTARYVVDVRGDMPSTRYYAGFVWRTQAWLNNDTGAAADIGFSYYNELDSLRVRLIGESTALTAGVNTITVKNLSSPYAGVVLSLLLDSVDVLYETALDLTAGLGQLEFAHWRDQVPAPGTATDFRLTYPDAAPPVVWDVTRPDSALVVAGTVAGGAVTWGVVREPDGDRHFLASRTADLLAVTSGTRLIPDALPALDGAVDYLVVTAPAFLTAAADLAAYRSTELPGVASPVARAVSAEAVYAHYSGGQKDPLAIRNYLRDVWRAGGHRLSHACFLGKASRDYRNYKGRTPLVDLYDLLPTVLRTSYPLYPVPLETTAPFASDDGLVSFDSPPASGGSTTDYDFPDVACGRLPALNAQQARAMVQRAIAAADDPEAGDWRNRVVMTADDTARPHANPYDEWTIEIAHVREAEVLANNYLPQSLDLHKLYGVAYPFPPGGAAKPALRADISAALNDGASLLYYVGHGAEDNLADEQIFRSSDIGNLGNGGRRPVFIAFSCDVGVYDSPTRRSMAEQFLDYDAGGGIGAICASQVSWITPNNLISEAFFGHLYPSRRVSGERTLAQALMLGKALMTSLFVRANSQRYNVMGEPGYRLPNAIDDLSFATASLDTLRAGSRQVVRLDAGSLAAAGDTYELRVEDSSWDRSFQASQTDTRTFVEPGAPAFAGNGTIAGNDLVVPFRSPAQVRYGSTGRARLVVSTPDGDHAAVQVVPAVRGSVGVVDDVRGPAIRLAFADGRYRVRPGDPLTAALDDTSGIAILGTSPGNSLLLEMDGTGRMTDVTTSFTYDANSYTSGSLVFPLPADLAAGAHRVALHASDALGNVGSDTLSFQIVPSGVAGIEDVTLFPNPTPGPCRLLFELSDPMAVQWDIYSLAGSRLRTLRAEFAEAGPRILEWDGRDSMGDEIANGTYLYVLRGNGAAADGREITKTGKLVIMR